MLKWWISGQAMKGTDKKTCERALTWSDGGARGNPGPAAIGAVVKCDGSDKKIDISERIGEATNNVAEYRAILAALSAALELGAERVLCRLDSELVVKQLNGDYRIRDARLIELARKVKALEEKFRQVEYVHVRREQNKEADKLVNKALDAK